MDAREIPGERGPSDNKVKEVTYDNTSARIKGKFTDGDEFHTTGLTPFPSSDLKLLSEHKVVLKPKTPQAGLLEQWLPILIFPALIIGFFVFMQRRAQGQMGNIMSIGRSRAKTYSTERPGTTFADVAGYEGVKTEIREVVDFLKYPEASRLATKSDSVVRPVDLPSMMTSVPPGFCFRSVSHIIDGSDRLS